MSRRAESILDERSRTVLPEAVREVLSLRPGDAVVFEVTGQRVTLLPSRHIPPAVLAELDGVFADWDDPGDDEAFADLSEPAAGA